LDAIDHVDKLRMDAQPVILPANAAFQNHIHFQGASDLANIFRAPSRGKRIRRVYL
jgi:hypothetical protein